MLLRCRGARITRREEGDGTGRSDPMDSPHGRGASAACSHARSELDLTDYDQIQDQHKIAGFYSQEAARLRLMARDLDHRAVVYERLFGPGSDWVAGARLLARSYDDAAQIMSVQLSNICR